MSSTNNLPKFCSGFGQKDTPKHSKHPEEFLRVTMADIAHMAENPKDLPKETGPWMIPSTLPSRVSAEQREKGNRYALTFDKDKNPEIDFDEFFNLAGGVIPGALIAYTTKGATEEDQRARAIVPLAEPVSGEMGVILQTIFNNRMEAAGVTPDRAMERPNQICYLPNKGEYYQSLVNDFTPPFNPLVAWDEDVAKIQEQIEAEKENAKLRHEASIIKAAERAASGELDVIGACKQSMGIETTLEHYGYKRCGEKYLSPRSESGNPGVSIDGQKATSFHNSDSEIGLKCNGCVKFDSWDLYKFHEHDNNETAAIKAMADMLLTPDGNKEVQREFKRKENRKTTEKMFENIDDEDPLSEFCLNGDSKKMEKQMLNDIHILGRLALLGQWTMLYAKPNGGKTLLTVWMLIEAIKAGVLNGMDVYYLNCDDTHKGLTYKLKLAEDNGFNMMSPGYKGFKSEMLTVILQKLIEGGSAKGKVLVLDTIKKFTDLMKKDKSSEFGEAVRQFVLHGGSLIGLAHTNKHRGNDGEVIHAGTSDLVDDCDCAFTLDVISDDKWEGERVVKFENFKNRGDVALEASYSYDAGENRTYQERLDSIECLDKTEVERAELYRKREKLFLKNKDVVDDIKEILREKPMNQKDLIQEVRDESGIGRDRIIRVLKNHAGLNVSSFQFWDSKKSTDKNEKIYTLNG
jgi:hypothetical protein